LPSHDGSAAGRDLLTRRNTSPEKPGGSSINQVRTNEIVLSTKGPWQLRELH
jgi:hypothetical protein